MQRVVRGTVRPVITAAAILVLFTKIALGAWVTVDVPRPMVDAFGNPLCLVDMGAGGAGDDHPSMPNCCVLGCGQAFVWLPAAIPAAGLLVRHASAAASAPRLAAFELSPHEHRPGAQRAPPRAI